MIESGRQMNAHGIEFQLLEAASGQDDQWDPGSVQVSMNVKLDGCIVPSEREGARVSFGHAIVLDNMVEDSWRKSILRFLTQGQDIRQPLPESIWNRRTSDMVGSRPTWGVEDGVIKALQEGQVPGVAEIQSRLIKLYPEFDIAFLPSSDIQDNNSASSDAQSGNNCASILVNAATIGDEYVYHVDADPTSFPDTSKWAEAYGDYFNGEPGKPLLVSMILYLNQEWNRDWAADTLVLDSRSDTGVFVVPRPGRILLMEQDLIHRMTPPSSRATGAPRFSVVWKLVFIPKMALRDPKLTICRPEWGRPSSIGSAATVDSVMHQLFQKNKA